MISSTPLAHLQANAGANASFTSPAIDTTGADLIVIAFASYNAATTDITKITDSKGNTYTKLTDVSDSGLGGAENSVIAYKYGPAVGSGHTFSVDTTGTNWWYCDIEVTAWSGATGGAFDQQNGGTSSVAAIQTGSVTPTMGNELIIANVIGNAGAATWTIDGGFTISDQVSAVASSNFGHACAYLVQTSAAAANPTWTYSVSTVQAATIATFKQRGDVIPGNFTASSNGGVSLRPRVLAPGLAR